MDLICLLSYLGFNVVYELVFSDDVVWMARIPLPYNCFQLEDVSAS